MNLFRAGFFKTASRLSVLAIGLCPTWLLIGCNEWGVGGADNGGGEGNIGTGWSIAISPIPATITAGTQQQFTIVPNPPAPLSNFTVSWSISGANCASTAAGCGTLNRDSGTTVVYTAPSIP